LKYNGGCITRRIGEAGKSDVYHAVEGRDGSSAGEAADSVLSVRTVSECWFVMVTTCK
jgi:hypothetical protein